MKPVFIFLILATVTLAHDATLFHTQTGKVIALDDADQAIESGTAYTGQHPAQKPAALYIVTRLIKPGPQQQKPFTMAFTNREQALQTARYFTAAKWASVITPPPDHLARLRTRFFPGTLLITIPEQKL